MNYKELQQIAKEVGAVIDVHMLGRHDNTVFTTGELERFAKALIAEIAKQNEPVAWARYPKFTGSTQRQEVVFKKPDDLHNWVCHYTIPPTAEQIANETAEACAAYITSGRYMVLNPGGLISAEIHTQYIKNHDIYQANAIRRGAWKEFKK